MAQGTASEAAVVTDPPERLERRPSVASSRPSSPSSSSGPAVPIYERAATEEDDQGENAGRTAPAAFPRSVSAETTVLASATASRMMASSSA